MLLAALLATFCVALAALAAAQAARLRGSPSPARVDALTAENGQVVGVSQLYTSRTAAQDGAASVQSVLATLDLI